MLFTPSNGLARNVTAKADANGTMIDSVNNDIKDSVKILLY